jgi:hypothetical protein
MGEVVRMARDGADYASRDGARALGDRIVAYWRRRGFMGIAITITDAPYTVCGIKVGTHSLVRSNIGPKGFPPRI